MDDTNDFISHRAKELYDSCDIDGKGFIVKPEMERLVSMLNLSQEQLNTVFDFLDDDGDGRLTLEEFTDGFGQFIEGDARSVKKKRHSSVFSVGFGGNEEKVKILHGAISGTAFSRETVSDLYEQLQKQYPDLLPEFENLLSKLSQEIEKSHLKAKKIETKIFREATQHEENVRNIYSEMETQIKAEETRLLNEERIRERIIREEKRQELQDKERHYQETLLKYEKTKKRLEDLELLVGETQQDVEDLLEEKDMLEEALEENQINLEQSQFMLEKLRNKDKEDRRQRAEAVGTISVKISSEKEIILRQLRKLREINKKLRDEKDEGFMRSLKSNEHDSPVEDISKDIKNYSVDITNESGVPKGQTDLRKINLADASRLFGNSMSFSTSLDESAGDDDDGIEVDEEPPTMSEGTSEYRQLRKSLSISFEEPIFSEEIKEKTNLCEAYIQTDSFEASSKNEASFSLSQKYIFAGDEMPQYVFKIVLLGDSGVGKTAISQRFVNENFQSLCSPTVGVDFHLRSVIVDGYVIALQIWDTAGQERFRSITKQYYRKSDGVILVYDVMEIGSFLNIRNWMDIIDRNTDDDAVLMLVGNKLDIGQLKTRAIPTKQAYDLSQKKEALFFEVSAATGENITESFCALARALKSRQDKNLKVCTQVNMGYKRSTCCGQKNDEVQKRSTMIKQKKNG